jgi:NADPH2:quinone reductase
MLRGGPLASGGAGERHPFRGVAIFALYIVGGWSLPGRRRVIPYSIQRLKRRKPAQFRQDLTALFNLLKQGKIKPLVAQRLPLVEAKKAQELLGAGGVTGKIVLVPNRSTLEGERRNERLKLARMFPACGVRSVYFFSPHEPPTGRARFPLL